MVVHKVWLITYFSIAYNKSKKKTLHHTLFKIFI